MSVGRTKLEAIQEGQNLVVAFTNKCSQAIATNNHPEQRSILVQELLKFFTKHFTLVIFDRAIRTVATDYATLYDLITRIAADDAHGLVGSLATICYEDHENKEGKDKCCSKRGRSLTMVGSEHLFESNIIPGEQQQVLRGLIVLENRYDIKEVKKCVFKFKCVELRAVERGDFVTTPFDAPVSTLKRNILVDNKK